MFFKKPSLFLTLLFIAALALTACTDKREAALDRSEAIIVKMEEVAKKADFTPEDYAQCKQLLSEFQTQGQKDAAAFQGEEPTAEIAQRAQELAGRFMSASMQCETKNMDNEMKERFQGRF